MSSEKNKITRKDIISKVSEEHGIPKSMAGDIVKQLFGLISQKLENGTNVKLSGFGKFTLHCKEERAARNPKTGEPFSVSKRHSVTFKAGSALNKELNDVE